MTGPPPTNLEAEENVLGAMLLSPTAISTAGEILKPDHFYRYTHGIIFQACLDLAARDRPVDPISLADQLEQHGQLERAGGASRVAELAALVPAAANVGHYAAIVRDTWTRREIIMAGQEIARLGREPGNPLDDTLEFAEQRIFELTTSRDPGDLRHVSETLPHTFQQLERPGGEITGTPTGLTDLDRITAGLQPGNQIVVAARPGMGKSALALQTAVHTTVHRGQPAAVFTLEMSAEEINQRALSVLSGVPLMKIRTRNGLTVADRSQLADAGERLQHAPLYVDDTVAARVTDIRARSRRLKSRLPGLALVVVDYVQLMIHDGTGRENREQQVAAISRGLKLLARELELPVMALAQLNRNPEHRHDKRATLADLRDSGALEQDADLVIFIYRDDEAADITVAKHRNGPTDRVPVTWLGPKATFANLAEEHPNA